MDDLAESDDDAEFQIAEKVMLGEWGEAFIAHIHFTARRALTVLKDEGVSLVIERADGAPPKTDLSTLNNGQLLKVLATALPQLVLKGSVSDRVRAAGALVIGCHGVFEELVNPSWDGGEHNIGKLALLNTGIGAYSAVLWGPDAVMGAAREKLEREIKSQGGSKAGKASAAARAWWHKVALPRAREKRRLKPGISTADLGRLLKTEMERSYPPGAGGRPNKLPKTTDGYESAIRAWEKTGELPRQATPA